MHTYINDSLPMQSRLIFDNTDDPKDKLFTHEIYNMNISASMVVLSACNTGSGELKKGEGIMSLARGFIYAGVPSIVMTLWEVNDATGSEIMTNYYNNLSDGDFKDVAMQKAKLSVLQNSNMAKAHPFFWSAPIINGNTSSISISKHSNYTILIISFLLFVLVVGVTWSFWQKKSGTINK